jgi:alcohol oxidase
VQRVLFDATSTPPRATGIEVESSASEFPTTIRAHKLVLLAAGALATPQILERSGVGSAELLGRLGINVMSDLPGVGENYQDHPSVFASYKTTLGTHQTLDEFWSGRMSMEQAVKDKHSSLFWNGLGESLYSTFHSEYKILTKTQTSAAST